MWTRHIFVCFLPVKEKDYELPAKSVGTISKLFCVKTSAYIKTLLVLLTINHALCYPRTFSDRERDRIPVSVASKSANTVIWYGKTGKQRYVSTQSIRPSLSTDYLTPYVSLVTMYETEFPRNSILVRSTSIQTSFQHINGIQEIRYRIDNNNNVNNNNNNNNKSNTLLVKGANTINQIFPWKPKLQNTSIQSSDNNSIPIVPVSAYSLITFTASIMNDSMINVTKRPETSNERMYRYVSYVHDLLLNFTLTCSEDTSPSNSSNISLIYDFNIDIDERLHLLVHSLDFCLEDDFCPRKEEIEINPNFTLASIRDEIIPPAELFISSIATLRFNVSTEYTNFDEGNATNCPIGYTRFSNETDCVIKDKYMISISELWSELSRPARNILGVLSALDLLMTNVSINCTTYNLTERPIVVIPTPKDANDTNFILNIPTTPQPTEKPQLNCSMYNMSAACNMTVPEKCYQLTQQNETFLDLLSRFEFAFAAPILEVNCSLYDIYDYPNLTLYEIWDVVNQPSTTLFSFLTNILVNLTDVSINCSKHNNDTIHSNVTLPKILSTLLESNNKTLYTLSSIFFRIPNFTITCYDYVFPVNITIPYIPPIPWYDDPRTFLIGGGSILFILIVIILSRVCKYCQKYSGVYVPGSEITEQEKKLERKQKMKEKKAKAYARECKRKGYRDPHRPKRKKRKRKKKKRTKLTAEQQRQMAEAARDEWVLRHIDSIPDIQDTPV